MTGEREEMEKREGEGNERREKQAPTAVMQWPSKGYPGTLSATAAAAVVVQRHACHCFPLFLFRLVSSVYVFNIVLAFFW